MDALCFDCLGGTPDLKKDGQSTITQPGILALARWSGAITSVLSIHASRTSAIGGKRKE